jgi:hypothetical protein
MPPTSASFDISHSGEGNAVFVGHLACRFGGCLLPDSQHVGRLQTGITIVFAALHRFRMRSRTMAVSYRAVLAALHYHVSGIVARVANEQMVRAHAQRIIAVMAYKLAVWYGRAVKDQRHSMRILWDAVLPETTIASAPLRTCPKPTIGGALDACEKILKIARRALSRSKVRRHTAWYLSGCLFATIFVGCARFHSAQVETAVDGTQRTTHIYVLTLFDAHSDLTKLRASTTEKTQGLSLAGLSENASSTNFVHILELIASIAAASAK